MSMAHTVDTGIKELMIEMKCNFDDMELRLKKTLQQMKHDLTMRIGAMLIVWIGILTVLMKLL